MLYPRLSLLRVPACATMAFLVWAVPLLGAEEQPTRTIKSPSQRLSELEDRVRALEGQVRELEEEKRQAEEEADSFFADGVITIGGVELRLGGRIDLVFVDTENFSDPVVGETDEKDPYFEVNRLRIVPELKFNRHISAKGQIDFSPETGETELREISARHRVRLAWWFRSTFELGLDDRVIRQARRTRTHFLAGNAFWRRETLGAIWSLRFGDRQGDRGDEEDFPDVAELTDESLDYLRSDNVGRFEDETVDPFDFASNPGELTIHLSGGQGPVLDNEEIGFDNAGFNDIIQDGRNIDDDRQLSEVGVALEYGRDFFWLGDITVLGFFYHNTLGDESVDFLQEELTIRDNAGNPIEGYGDSDKQESWRYGIGGSYFFPASTLFGEEITRGNDGLRVLAQWIHGDDGDLEREGWYVQGSYRYSFPERLIAGRYLMSVEPLVRYGELDTNLGPFVDLPTTWDRERWVVGLNVEVTNEILLRAEYAFNSEDTGGSPGSVDNDELVVEMRLYF